MKASVLLKHNIDTLLKARHQTRHDLAVWVRQSTDAKKVDPWISQIFTRPDREFQMKYLDRIADFFGIAVYQLFQPGISPLTERRKGRDRRGGRDRRISANVLSEKPGDVDVMSLIRALSTPGRQRALAHLVDLVNDELRGPRTPESDAADSAHTGGTRRVKRAPTPTRREP